MLMVTGVSLLGILTALVVATAVMFTEAEMFTAPDDQTVTVATAGGGCGIGESKQ